MSTKEVAESTREEEIQLLWTIIKRMNGKREKPLNLGKLSRMFSMDKENRRDFNDLSREFLS